MTGPVTFDTTGTLDVIGFSVNSKAVRLPVSLALDFDSYLLGLNLPSQSLPRLHLLPRSWDLKTMERGHVSASQWICEISQDITPSRRWGSCWRWGLHRAWKPQPRETAHPICVCASGRFRYVADPRVTSPLLFAHWPSDRVPTLAENHLAQPGRTLNCLNSIISSFWANPFYHMLIPLPCLQRLSRFSVFAGIIRTDGQSTGSWVKLYLDHLQSNVIIYPILSRISACHSFLLVTTFCWIIDAYNMLL
jgi:hypothetical protein